MGWEGETAWELSAAALHIGRPASSPSASLVRRSGCASTETGHVSESALSDRTERTVSYYDSLTVSIPELFYVTFTRTVALPHGDSNLIVRPCFLTRTLNWSDALVPLTVRVRGDTVT